MTELGHRKHGFPSRQYGYSVPFDKFTAETTPSNTPFPIYRFILGQDPQPVPLSMEKIQSQLHDPFARLVLLQAKSPLLTARTLTVYLDRFNSDPSGLPFQASFVVADGGQIRWSAETESLNRQIRFAIVRSKALHDRPDLMISTSSLLDDESTFLQVIGWDEVAGAYQFYDRREGAWTWAGSSWDALVPASRGQGPFDSHINGALNMKELKIPWVNWHSQAAAISDEILAKNDPLRSEPLWTKKSGAEDFENEVARPGIDRWLDARFAKCMTNGRVNRLPEFFLQVLDTTTINLVSSPTQYGALSTGEPVTLPPTFFLNTEIFLDILQIDADLKPPTVSAEIYRNCLQHYNVALIDNEQKFRFPGDTHFVFVVPEAAHEDNAIAHKLLLHGVLSRKLATALYMIDFSNPVFSRRRSQLSKYVPVSALIGNTSSFETWFVQQVRTGAASLPADSPEHEFLDLWDQSTGWEAACAEKLKALLKNVQDRIRRPQGFYPIFELAESRRREFRKRPLAEFRLTTPTTNIVENAPLLELTPDGSVQPKR
jgi:hypothetical protein